MWKSRLTRMAVGVKERDAVWRCLTRRKVGLDELVGEDEDAMRDRS
jgi:hypothetical protein